MTATKSDNEVREISDLFEVFGKYQVLQFATICLPALFVTMININYIFVAGDVNYRCRVEECEGIDSTVEYPLWWPNRTIDRCSRPVVRQDLEQEVCTNTSFTEELAECTEWVYESNNTVVAELNLACQPWKINLIGTVHSMGMLVSVLVSGWMSDQFGRKPTLIFCVVAGCIGQLKTFATTYYVYIFIEFLEAAATGGSYTAAMVLLLEVSGKQYRILSGMIFACTNYVGESMFALIAMFVLYWKTLIHIINGPSILFLSYIFLIHESPRWQVVRGKIENAKTSMKRIAKINNINIDYNELANTDENTLKEKLNIIEHEVKERYIDIFTSREILKRMLVAAVCRFTSTFVYYGLMINSVWLPGDKHTNFFLSTVMSFPGELISLYLMTRLGRKLTLMIGYTISGVMCVASAYVPVSYTWTKIATFLISKVVIAACFTGAITYSMELFPTSARGSLIGLCAFASRMGGMLAPLTPILNTISPVLPSIFFGCSAILAGSLIALTPETKDLPLMDTIRQVDDYTKKQANINIDSVGNSMDTYCGQYRVKNRRTSGPAVNKEH